MEGTTILGSFLIQNQNEKKQQQGQSTVEFALTLILFLAFILFYFQLSMIFAFGNYAHYATFMSARAMLSAGATKSDQVTRAKDVIILTLKKSAGQAGVDKFPMIAKGFGEGEVGGLALDAPEQYKAGDRTFSWMQGVRYTFKGKLFLIPFGGSSGKTPTGDTMNSISLTSESWLGREPSEEECRTYMKNGWFFDNGC